MVRRTPCYPLNLLDERGLLHLKPIHLLLE
jgi:hypothetical protein